MNVSDHQDQHRCKQQQIANLHFQCFDFRKYNVAKKIQVALLRLRMRLSSMMCGQTKFSDSRLHIYLILLRLYTVYFLLSCISFVYSFIIPSICFLSFLFSPYLCYLSFVSLLHISLIDDHAGIPVADKYY
jgi:hypothetical protein